MQTDNSRNNSTTVRQDVTFRTRKIFERNTLTLFDNTRYNCIAEENISKNWTRALLLI